MVRAQEQLHRVGADAYLHRAGGGTGPTDRGTADLQDGIAHRAGAVERILGLDIGGHGTTYAPPFDGDMREQEGWDLLQVVVVALLAGPFGFYDKHDARFLRAARAASGSGTAAQTCCQHDDVAIAKRQFRPAVLRHLINQFELAQVTLERTPSLERRLHDLNWMTQRIALHPARPYTCRLLPLCHG